MHVERLSVSQADTHDKWFRWWISTHVATFSLVIFTTVSRFFFRHDTRSLRLQCMSLNLRRGSGSASKF